MKQFVIRIPAKADGTYDAPLQKQIAARFAESKAGRFY
jgi:hypothetical protein